MVAGTDQLVQVRFNHRSLDSGCLGGNPNLRDTCILTGIHYVNELLKRDHLIYSNSHLRVGYISVRAEKALQLIKTHFFL